MIGVSNVARYLAARGVVASPDDVLACAPLGGGVSSSVTLVETASGRLVVKQPLEHLRVAADWRASRTRALAEAAALEVAASAVPGTTPALVDVDEHALALTMTAAPSRWRPWKERLLAGSADAGIASRLGEVIARLHAAGAPALAADRAGGLARFVELRIDPYHDAVARAHPELAGPLLDAAHELTHGPDPCLVHGDFSPKNVLVGHDGLWVLDFEVAHLGNAIFDVAFMLSHLVLKSVHRPDRAPSYRDAARSFLDAYTSFRPRELAQRDLALHTGCLVLARVDGKSPVEYLSPPERDAARRVGRGLLLAPRAVLDQWPHGQRTTSP
ncbi:MAG: phosphotransferase [Actinomycetota bacterium]|nr:phosphotransferase [Actinomycetota bacterium]